MWKNRRKQHGKCERSEPAGPAEVERKHGPEDARALRSYLYQMQEQLQYVLTNLDVENLSEELRTRLNSL